MRSRPHRESSQWLSQSCCSACRCLFGCDGVAHLTLPDCCRTGSFVANNWSMATSAPTSADACLSIVHSLMCHRQVRRTTSAKGNGIGGLTIEASLLVYGFRVVNLRALAKGPSRVSWRSSKRNGTSWTAWSRPSPPTALIPQSKRNERRQRDVASTLNTVFPGASPFRGHWTGASKWPDVKGSPTWFTPGYGDGQIYTRTNWNK